LPLLSEEGSHFKWAFDLIKKSRERIFLIEKKSLEARFPLDDFSKSNRKEATQIPTVVTIYEGKMFMPLKHIDLEIDTILRVFGLTKNSIL
jgi:hypothetical protein